MSQIVEAELAPTDLESAGREGILVWIASVDHKQIGILYFISSMFFFLIGGLEALVIRIQLLAPGLHLISPDTFNQMFTIHGTTMIFLFVMPMLTGFGTYLIPLMIGARDMAFPRLNALSFWIQLFGGIILYFSFLTQGGASSAGWFAYAPLSEKAYSSLSGVDFWIVAVACIGIGTVAAAINFVVTIVCLRTRGLTIRRLPLFVWMTLVNSFLVISAIPILNAALALLLIDRFFNAHVFDPAGGGSALLWQHYFWAFGHPEVYIMILPAFGIISEVIPVFSGKPIYGYEFVAASTVAIAFLSFTVWAHHMFAVGMSQMGNLFFAVSSMLIAVPTGVKIFNWTATMYGGRIRFKTAMMFAVAFLITFTIGGLTGVSFALFPLDWQLTDTYYLVAHFHYVLFGGSVFGIFAGFYYWFPKMTGRMLSERLGQIHFWLTFIGFKMAFFIQHILGLAGMPRRVYTYPDLPGWAAMNLISSIGAFILGLSVLVFLWNIFESLAHGEIADDNPWDAWTLEWATTSPPPPENFIGVPPVHGRRPLWDLAFPDRADESIVSSERASSVRNYLPAQNEAESRNMFLTLKDRSKIGVGLFILSEINFFLMLIIAYVYYHAYPGPGPTAVTALNPMRTGMFSVALFSSSVTMWMASRAARRPDSKGLVGWLAITIALGVLFMVGQAQEYLDLFHHSVTISRNLFAATFFALTGFHGLHVIVGLIALTVTLILARAGKLHEHSKDGFGAVEWYWHFVDAVWVVVFSVMYLWGVVAS